MIQSLRSSQGVRVLFELLREAGPAVDSLCSCYLLRIYFDSPDNLDLTLCDRELERQG